MAMTVCRALAVFGDAEAVIDRAITAGGVEARSPTDQIGGHAGELFDLFRAVTLFGDEFGPVLEFRPVAALADKGFVIEAFGDDDMGERRDDGDIRAGAERQMVIGLHMWGHRPDRCGAGR